MPTHDRSMLHSRIVPIVAAAQEARVFGRASIGVRLEDGAREVFHFGFGGLPVAPDDSLDCQPPVFDAASLTKVVPTGMIALRLILEGKLDQEARVCEMLPEFRTSHREQVRVRHLLTHALDYRVPLSSLRNLPPAELVDRVLTHQFGAEPGSVFLYGNPSSLVLGLLLERLCAMDLQAAGEQLVWGPLGMRDTGFWPQDLQRAPVAHHRIVPSELCQWRGRALVGEVHDESAWALQQDGPGWRGRAMGHAGVFTTVPDLLQLLDCLLQDGMLDGARMLPAGILALTSTDALGLTPPGEAGPRAALGFELCNRRFMGECVGPRAFGKTGFTGASLLADPDRGVAVAMLTDFTWPRREPNVERIYAFRRAIHNAVLASC